MILPPPLQVKINNQECRLVSHADKTLIFHFVLPFKGLIIPSLSKPRHVSIYVPIIIFSLKTNGKINQTLKVTFREYEYDCLHG